MPKQTITLTPRLEARVRNLQAHLMLAAQRNVSFNQALNYMLAMAFTRSLALGQPGLKQRERQEAMNLAEGMDMEDFFEPIQANLRGGQHVS